MKFFQNVVYKVSDFFAEAQHQYATHEVKLAPFQLLGPVTDENGNECGWLCLPTLKVIFGMSSLKISPSWINDAREMVLGDKETPLWLLREDLEFSQDGSVARLRRVKTWDEAQQRRAEQVIDCPLPLKIMQVTTENGAKITLDLDSGRKLFVRN